MEKFANYLISKSIIPENQIPYYIGWVKAFFRFLDKDMSETVTADEIDRYIKGLVKVVEAEQLIQAREAIQAFCFFQGQPSPAVAERDPCRLLKFGLKNGSRRLI